MYYKTDPLNLKFSFTFKKIDSWMHSKKRKGKLINKNNNKRIIYTIGNKCV